MNQRDTELLSAYLDGQLSSSDSIRLEARLKTDPELASVMDDLRVTRSVLRKLPQRRAPRNFTLTRKMVGQNPPLPRAYPLFRYATAFATLLFIFSFGLNLFNQAAAHPFYGIYGIGGSGGGGSSDAVQPFAAAQAPATEAPAATEAPLMQAPLAPAPTQSSPEIANGSRIIETPASKTGVVTNPSAPLPVQQEVQNPAPLVPSTWQTGLAVIAVIGAFLMFVMQRMAINRWRQK